MDEALVRRVKNSLNNQHYIMNDSWLAECIEYYLNDNARASQDEIMTFVRNQWELGDLREINNEKGCLPKDLARLKCTKLPGKYILQMEKMYDISQSKYKQLEKIRHVSSENVEATEHENAQDKFQNFEPKSKRMLQLFLTDGIQDVLAIEYKPIRFLKDSLYPGFKVMIKGPVVCRKGVILLEEINFAEVGGEVDSLLITNAVENIFARALNLEENPDPYNDTNKQTQSVQTQSTQRTAQMDDDFDIDSQVLDQIEEQIQQQSFASSKNSTVSATRNTPAQVSRNSSNSSHKQNSLASSNRTPNITTSEARNVQYPPSASTSKNKTPQQQSSHSSNKRVTDFDDDADSFFDMVDDKAFQNVPPLKPVFKVPELPPPLFKKPLTSSKVETNTNIDDFPTDDEVYDLTESPPTSVQSKSQNKTNVINKASCSSIGNSSNNSYKAEYKNATPSSSGYNKNASRNLESTSSKYSIPDDDFDVDEMNMETDDFNDYFNKDSGSKTNSAKSSQSSTGSSKFKNSNVDIDRVSNSNKNTKNSLHSSHETEFEDEFDTKFEVAVNKDLKSSTNQQINNKKSSVEETKSISPKSSNPKRSADQIPTAEEAPQKVRCLQSTPKSNKSNERKITDFLSAPPDSANNKREHVLTEDGIKCYELLKDALKLFHLTKNPIIIVVRGKVINVVKLNLLKNESGPYFHLEGTITDNTANLDVVFSSEVLEKIIGYSPREFSRKRKQCKIDPSIKDQLREDLNKAQQALTVMDELMEIELKKNEKALIVNSVKLTNEQKKAIDDRLKLL